MDKIQLLHKLCATSAISSLHKHSAVLSVHQSTIGNSYKMLRCWNEGKLKQQSTVAVQSCNAKRLFSFPAWPVITPLNLFLIFWWTKVKQYSTYSETAAAHGSSTKLLRRGTSSSSKPIHVGSPSEATSQNESFAGSSNSGMSSSLERKWSWGEREMRCGKAESCETARVTTDYCLQRARAEERGRDWRTMEKLHCRVMQQTSDHIL